MLELMQAPVSSGIRQVVTNFQNRTYTLCCGGSAPPSIKNLVRELFRSARLRRCSLPYVAAFRALQFYPWERHRTRPTSA